MAGAPEKLMVYTLRSEEVFGKRAECRYDPFGNIVCDVSFGDDIVQKEGNSSLTAHSDGIFWFPTSGIAESYAYLVAKPPADINASVVQNMYPVRVYVDLPVALVRAVSGEDDYGIKFTAAVAEALEHACYLNNFPSRRATGNRARCSPYYKSGIYHTVACSLLVQEATPELAERLAEQKFKTCLRDALAMKDVAKYFYRYADDNLREYQVLRKVAKKVRDIEPRIRMSRNALEVELDRQADME